MTYFQIEKHQDIAVIWLDQTDAPVNKIGPQMIAECSALLDEMEQDASILGAVLISRKKDFIAGADLETVYAVREPGEWLPTARKGHALLQRIENSPKPVVAAIHGAAMGGGLEVALACHYRLASDNPSTVMALPEVQLGLLPGGGGTQRLPQLVGIQTALDMMLTGKKIYAQKALKIGLIDRIVNEHALLKAAIAQARELIGKKIVRSDKRSFKEKLIEKNPIGRSIIFEQARKKVHALTKGNYPAPFKIIECVETGAKFGSAAGYETELKKFDELLIHPVAKSLIELFFAMTDKKKNPNAPLVKPVNNILMLGAGFMGEGIAEVSINNDINIIIKDIQQSTLSTAQSNIWKNLTQKVKRKVLLPLQAEKIFNKLGTTLQYDNLKHTDMVIEAVFEDIGIKQKVLAECEKTISNGCIFATNTSALPIAEIARHAQHPELVVGMHYFSPVPKMPLLEIVVTPQTAGWVAATAFETGIRQGKTCIVVQDGPGFYTTRILAPLLNEALLLLEEGGDINQIDEAAKQAGFPVGPITLIDEVGIDVGAHIMSGKLVELFRERGGDAFIMSTLVEKMFKAGFFGRKNRKGFFVYDQKGEKKKGAVNTTVYDLFLGGLPRKTFKDKEIRYRLQMIMTNEAVRCLQEGIISNPTDGNLGAVLGLGYPPFTGGPFRYIDAMGANKAVERLNKLAENYGERFVPCELLCKFANEKRKFHD